MRGSLGGLDLHAVAVLGVMLIMPLLVELPVNLVEEEVLVGVLGVVEELVLLQLVPLGIWRRRLTLSAWQGEAGLGHIDIHACEFVSALVVMLVVLLTEFDVLVGLVAELLLVVHLVTEDLLMELGELTVFVGELEVGVVAKLVVGRVSLGDGRLFSGSFRCRKVTSNGFDVAFAFNSRTLWRRDGLGYGCGRSCGLNCKCAERLEERADEGFCR
jgi:hypothetical protein